MKNINIFYHYYIDDEVMLPMWHYWLDEQLTAIQNAGLDKKANVFMCISMPMYLTHINDFIIADNNEDYNSKGISFFDKVSGYIKWRYPFVKIINVRDSSEVNLYEGLTLSGLYHYCLQYSGKILYIHNKGGISFTPGNPAVKMWLEALDYYMITEWEDRIKELDEYDLVGMGDLCTKKTNVMSGNFFWTNAEYVRTLAQPLDVPTYDPNNEDYRYAFEQWINTGNPKKLYFINTEVDHYNTYYKPIRKDK